jgi:hypothetical protein
MAHRTRLAALFVLALLAWGNPARFMDCGDRCITYGNDLSWCVPHEYPGPEPFSPFW